MINTVFNTIKKYKMLQNNDKIVVGISGGADSVCLIFLLTELKKIFNIKIYACHINHGIRGHEADKDEEYVKEICDNLKIELNTYHFEIKKEAARLGLTEEETGRKIRYECFNKTLLKYNANKIAVAHNKNDNAETILFNIMRGSGTVGLSGIAPIRENIIRPLIQTERKEIEDYLIKKNIKYKTDSTNKMDIYTRNKIRIHMIPWIEENINPNIISALSQSADIIRQENSYIDSQAQIAFKSCVNDINKDKIIISVSKLNTFDEIIKKRVIRIAFLTFKQGLYNISYKHTISVLNLTKAETGNIVYLPRQIYAKKIYDFIEIGINKENINIKDYKINIIPEKKIYINEINKWVYLTSNAKNIQNIIYKHNNLCTYPLDYDKIKGELLIRQPLSNDKIFIEGINGNKLIKKLFSEKHIPLEKRILYPALTYKNDLVLVCGLRISDLYKKNVNTKNIMYFYFWEE